MNEITSTALKSLISVISLFMLSRLMGKKQISQLSFFDYVVGMSLGSIAATFAIDSTISYYCGITSLTIYALFPILMSHISLKSYRGRKFLDGTPIILIQNGQIVERNLVQTKINMNDLLAQCRLKNAFDISEVEFAILETSGKFSVQMKSSNQPLTPKDIELPISYKGLCTNLIIDGNILSEHLKAVGKDNAWLINTLSNQNIDNPANVLLAYLDSSNILKCHLKHDVPQVYPLL